MASRFGKTVNDRPEWVGASVRPRLRTDGTHAVDANGQPQYQVRMTGFKPVTLAEPDVAPWIRRRKPAIAGQSDATSLTVGDFSAEWLEHRRTKRDGTERPAGTIEQAANELSLWIIPTLGADRLLQDITSQDLYNCVTSRPAFDTAARRKGETHADWTARLQNPTPRVDAEGVRIPASGNSKQLCAKTLRAMFRDASTSPMSYRLFTTERGGSPVTATP